ncbi:hypothetical protein [Pseudonocardia parietis]|uniref:MaoC dehydratase-like protein n=1 Tax=Pseudonocardia parietis TaxID=570936 RepID=A0ABS4VVP1_9PSEU|nr:hypothetical protein [Pseudonocardia parietis]MBP2367793.1 hypothetical protein [Pseudonocardia parietis]
MGVVAEDRVRSLVGHRFPGARYRIDAAAELELREVAGAAPAEGDTAHPLMVFLVAQGGIGIDLDSLFALCHAGTADGVMLGEWSVEQRAPLRIGAEYLVRGGIDDVVRKSGARAGVFDIVTMGLDVLGDGDPEPYARVRTSFVFPRRPR